MTRRKIVDVLTPFLANLGLKEREGLDEGWDGAEDWLPLELVIEDGPSSEAAGGCSLSAGWRAGTAVW